MRLVNERAPYTAWQSQGGHAGGKLSLTTRGWHLRQRDGHAVHALMFILVVLFSHVCPWGSVNPGAAEEYIKRLIGLSVNDLRVYTAGFPPHSTVYHQYNATCCPFSRGEPLPSIQGVLCSIATARKLSVVAAAAVLVLVLVCVYVCVCACLKVYRAHERARVMCVYDGGKGQITCGTTLMFTQHVAFCCCLLHGADAARQYYQESS